MPKYSVTIQYERTQVVEVEAKSKGEAMGLVNEGEFENEQITNTEDDYVQILGATLVKE
jgi:DNA-dependent RNA polymerase auxiliary subunit epsilon